MKQLIAAVAVVFVSLLFAVPVFASWSEKITGSMDESSITGLSIQLSAWTNEDNSWGGNGEYYYAANGNQFHLDVTRVCFTDNTANAIGYVKIQYGFGTVSQSDGHDWGMIAVKDNGESGDQVRALVGLDQTQAETECAHNMSYPAQVLVGDFKIRTR